MKRHKFIPTWRHGREPIEVFERPSAAWLNDRPRGRAHSLVRFVLMEDGRLFFCDGWDVVHEDCFHVGRRPGVDPFAVGVFSRRWNAPHFAFGNAQQRGYSTDRRAVVGAMLRALADWQTIAKELGYDPTKYVDDGSWVRPATSEELEVK